MEKITTFIKANKTAFIIGGVILLAVILYFALKKDGDTIDQPTSSGCPSSFTIKPTSGIAQVVSTTYSSGPGQWFKQLSGSVFGASGQLPKQSISEAEFMDACKRYKTPATGPDPV